MNITTELVRDTFKSCYWDSKKRTFNPELSDYVESVLPLSLMDFLNLDRVPNYDKIWIIAREEFLSVEEINEVKQFFCEIALNVYKERHPNEEIGFSTSLVDPTREEEDDSLMRYVKNKMRTLEKRSSDWYAMRTIYLNTNNIDTDISVLTYCSALAVNAENPDFSEQFEKIQLLVRGDNWPA